MAQIGNLAAASAAAEGIFSSCLDQFHSRFH